MVFWRLRYVLEAQVGLKVLGSGIFSTIKFSFKNFKFFGDLAKDKVMI